MFTENLQKYDNGDLTYQMSEGNLVELEQIDDKFRNMIHQIRRLKITLYEQELQKQKIRDGLPENPDPPAFLYELSELYLTA
mgnify:CR=1 FL=1